MEYQYGESIVKLETIVKRLEVCSDRWESILMGTDGRLGVLTRLDRIEQESERRKAHIKVLYAAIVAVVVKSVWEWLSK